MGLFPMGCERLAPRDPREEMEDTLCEMLCSVIPIQHNKNQTAWPQAAATPGAFHSAVPAPDAVQLP